MEDKRAKQKRIKARFDQINKQMNLLKQEGITCLFVAVPPNGKKIKTIYTGCVDQTKIKKISCLFKENLNTGSNGNLDFTDHIYVHDKREAISKWVKPYLESKKFYEEHNKPGWWPDDLPFHSVYHNKGNHRFSAKEICNIFENGRTYHSLHIKEETSSDSA